jgi:hypothetical protein
MGMFSKSSSSSVSAVMLKEARQRGKRDGKNEVPRQNWDAGSVPYLGQLNKQFIALASSMILKFEELQEQREALKISSAQTDIQEDVKLKMVQEDLEQAKAEMEKAQRVVDGTDDEAPLGRFARIRLINNNLYGFFLVVLGSGEFLITAPALRLLLGDRKVESNLVAFSVSVLSMAAAHVIGVSLKTKLDRSRPQTKIVTVILGVVVGFLTATVFYLSYIRAAKGFGVSNNLTEIPESLRLEFLWGLYSILQFTFIAVGSYLSFLHHSETESALGKAKRIYLVRKYLASRMEKKRRKQGASVEEANLAMDKLVEQEKIVLESKLNLLSAQYREVCAVYRDSNIHNRRDELDGAHPALKEEPLQGIGVLQN